MMDSMMWRICARPFWRRLLFAVPVAAGAQEVNLYTTREPGLIQPLLDAFTQVHGRQGQFDLRQGRVGRACRRRGRASRPRTC